MKFSNIMQQSMGNKQYLSNKWCFNMIFWYLKTYVVGETVANHSNIVLFLLIGRAVLNLIIAAANHILKYFVFTWPLMHYNYTFCIWNELQVIGYLMTSVIGLIACSVMECMSIIFAIKDSSWTCSYDMGFKICSVSNLTTLEPCLNSFSPARRGSNSKKYNLRTHNVD